MNKWVIFSLAALVVAGAAGSNKEVRALVMEPRGIRNNNPGNIRHGDSWQGMAEQQNDSAFVQFISPVWGVRALAKVLYTYRFKHGLVTVRQIISRWAPPNENNTEAYVNSVADALGVEPDHTLFFERPQVLALVRAIIKHENGKQPYDTVLLSEGITKAGWA